MYSQKDLEQEIDKQILGGMTSARWITNFICADHTENTYVVTDSHATLCQWHYTRKIVGLRMTKHVVNPPPTPGAIQIEIEGQGFEFLHPSYVVNRDDDDQLVSVYDLTPDEHIKFADTLEGEIATKGKHAKEHRLAAYLKINAHSAKAVK